MSTQPDNSPFKRCVKCNTDWGQNYNPKMMYCPFCGIELEIYVPNWMKKQEVSK